MFCTKCGNQLSADSVFCQYCGEQMVENALDADEQKAFEALINDPQPETPQSSNDIGFDPSVMTAPTAVLNDSDASASAVTNSGVEHDETAPSAAPDYGYAQEILQYHENPETPAKKKKKKLIPIIISASVLLLLGVTALIGWFFFRPDVKIMFSSPKEYLIASETLNLKNAAAGYSAEHTDYKLDIDTQLSLEQSILGYTTGYDAKIEGQIDTAKDFYDLLISGSLTGDLAQYSSFESAIKSDGDYLYFDVSELLGSDAKYYIDLSKMLVEENNEVISEDDAWYLYDVIIKECIINSIPDSDVTYNKNDSVNGDGCKSISLKITSKTIENICKAFADKLENDERLFEIILNTSAANSTGVSKDELEEDLRSQLELAAQELKQLKVSEIMEGKISYKIFFNQNEEVLKREVSVVDTASNLNISSSIMSDDNSFTVDVKANGITVISLKDEFEIDGDSIKGKCVLDVFSLGKITIKYDLTDDDKKYHLPLGTITFDIDTVAYSDSFTLTTEKDDDYYVTTFPFSYEDNGSEYTMNFTLKTNITDAKKVDKPDIDTSNSEELDSDNMSSIADLLNSYMNGIFIDDNAFEDDYDFDDEDYDFDFEDTTDASGYYMYEMVENSSGLFFYYAGFDPDDSSKMLFEYLDYETFEWISLSVSNISELDKIKEQ